MVGMDGVVQKPTIFMLINNDDLRMVFGKVTFVPHMVPKHEKVVWEDTEWRWQECQWYRSKSGLTFTYYYMYVPNGYQVKRVEIHRPVPIDNDPILTIPDPRGGKLTNTGVYEDAKEVAEVVAKNFAKIYGWKILLIDDVWGIEVYRVMPEKVYVARVGDLVFSQGNLRIYEIEGLPEDEVRSNLMLMYNSEALTVYNHVILSRPSVPVYGQRILRRGQMYIISGANLMMMSQDHGVSGVSLNPNKFYLIFHPSPRIDKD